MKPAIRPHISRPALALLAAGLLAGVAALALAVRSTAAQEAPPAPGSPMHPVFPLLDADGENVLKSGKPVSTAETCGACHDTAFIQEHSAHAGILTGALDAPAGEALMIHPETGQLTALDEATAGTEMNCFMCHSTRPNNDARLIALQEGRAEWASTATLVGTGLVEQAGDDYAWNEAAFDENGVLLPESVAIQDPAVSNCAQCHGAATSDAITPLVLDACATEQRATITTGQVFSPQRVSASGVNITGKDELTRTWDVHAERIVGCTDCHYALNNPAYASRPSEASPAHLVFDPRRLDPGEYLLRPSHELARSSDDARTGHGCISCHEVESTHEWLPYTARHMEAVACESCHVPRLEIAARQSIDWTVLALETGSPGFTCRGRRMDGENVIFTGYEPVLLPRDNRDGTTSIAPYNLITTWYWVHGAAGVPVALADLQAAFFEGDAYHPDVLAAFDANLDGALDATELLIDTGAKEAAVAGRLESLGLESPRIEASADAYAINHGVTHGDWAIRECEECHADDSRLVAPIALASNPPGGVLPTGDLPGSGEIAVGDDGTVYFRPLTGERGSGTYVFGLSRERLVDLAGALLFVGVLLAVTAHGGLRFLAARRQAGHSAPEVREVYMYTVYERFWHWLQTAVILLLIFTGLIIHKPELFGFLSFRGVVLMHNVLAVLLALNAAFSLFYHLASGEIRQFLPQPRGFFNDAIVQAKFYLRGIFSGEPHPFEKSPQRKMNPLQQITYLGLLNVLLPAQIITGALIWGAQTWPAVANALGGLPVLAPIHSMVAWLLASFVVAHVYLTTTGHEPLASIKAMMLGWDEVEVPGGPDHTAPETATTK